MGSKTTPPANVAVVVETAVSVEGQELTVTVICLTDCETTMAQDTTIQEHSSKGAKTRAKWLGFFVFILSTFLTLADWYGFLG